MKIAINDHRKIFAIEEEFNAVFPYLKIEFLSKPHEPGGTAGKKLVANASKTLGECRTIHNKGEITISAGMTVAELEQRFEDVYGLSIRVFRKLGKSWLSTNLTETWTLEKQNQEGQSLNQTTL